MTEQLATQQSECTCGTTTQAPEPAAQAVHDAAQPATAKKRPMLNQEKCC